ncbi:hypothetical protein OPAG_09362, partial [Rhodococcus opacus PD630]
MRFVHAGCGVNALSGLQSNAHIARKCRPDKRSASGNFAFIITLKPGKPGFFTSFAIIRKNVKCLAVSTSRCCALS